MLAPRYRCRICFLVASSRSLWTYVRMLILSSGRRGVQVEFETSFLKGMYFQGVETRALLTHGVKLMCFTCTSALPGASATALATGDTDATLPRGPPTRRLAAPLETRTPPATRLCDEENVAAR